MRVEFEKPESFNNPQKTSNIIFADRVHFVFGILFQLVRYNIHVVSIFDDQMRKFGQHVSDII